MPPSQNTVKQSQIQWTLNAYVTITAGIIATRVKQEYGVAQNSCQILPFTTKLPALACQAPESKPSQPRKCADIRLKMRPRRLKFHLLPMHKNTWSAQGSKTHGIASMLAGGGFLLPPLGSPTLAACWMGGRIGRETWKSGGLKDSGRLVPGYTRVEVTTEWRGENGGELWGSLVAPAMAATAEMLRPQCMHTSLDGNESN